MTGSAPGGPERGCGNDAAPYVLGALEPAEARAFMRHMRTCAVCRDEVAALTPVLDVLPSCVTRYDVRPELRRRVMHAVRSEPKLGDAPARERWRSPRRPWMPSRRSKLRRPSKLGAWLAQPRPAVAAGGALAVAVALVIVFASGSRGTQDRLIRASVGFAQLHIAGDRGELIVDHLPPAPPDRVYELWLQRGNRAPAPSTLFEVTSRGTAALGVPGEVTGITRVLVTVEPSGGSREPTTPAVIVARV
ncbi:MAG: anti-sigma factor domain-containing protein [Solirubrobacteraceae bacterium]